jgi:catechol 2,3-dioxygenase
MLGTDYPFNFHERAPVDRVARAGFDAAVTAQLVHRNAEPSSDIGAEARHESPSIAACAASRSTVPDLDKRERSTRDVWQLDVAARSDERIYLRGTGADHHLLALARRRHGGAMRHVTLAAREPRRSLRIAARPSPPAAGSCTAHGRSTTLRAAPALISDGDGRRIEVVHGDARHGDAHEAKDRPVRLAHVVLNSHAVDPSQRFFEQALGFRLADRTRIMAFLNCKPRSPQHRPRRRRQRRAQPHRLPDARRRVGDARRGPDEGRGLYDRVGPRAPRAGNNAFNYFVGPFGEVIEYTRRRAADRRDLSRRAPSDWTWPPGRVDQWGISAAAGARA